jgi:DNA modification methylase
MKCMAAVSVEGAIHFVCMDWRHVGEVLTAAEGVYSEQKNLCVWAKTNAGMGAFYRSQHELVFVFKVGTAEHVNNFGLGSKGRYRTNVWTYAGANTFREGRAEDLAAHPTVKPVAMIADAILDCSHRGSIILDPFAGSGTTLLAAEQTGRRGYGIELDPAYVDLCVRRLEQATGLEAIHEDGDSFAQHAQRRFNEREAA